MPKSLLLAASLATLGLTTAGPASWAAGDAKMTIPLSSSAFADQKPIPTKYSGDGADVSPPLAWDKLPSGTRELARVCDDPDAPSAEPWVHWVIYNVPADARGLPEGIAPDARPKNPAGVCKAATRGPRAARSAIAVRRRRRERRTTIAFTSTRSMRSSSLRPSWTRRRCSARSKVTCWPRDC